MANKKNKFKRKDHRRAYEKMKRKLSKINDESLRLAISQAIPEKIK